MRSAVILAGGKSSRFNYIDKQFIKINGKALLLHVIENISDVVEEVIIAARDEGQKEKIECILDLTDIRDFLDFKVTIDDILGFGPLSGILSGLKASSSEYSVILACDMPYLYKSVVKLLFAASKGSDALIPMWQNGLIEPLCAVYAKHPMIKATNESIKNKNRDIFNPISRLSDVLYLPVEILKEIDPLLKTFSNINDPKDLDRICKGGKEC